MRVHPSENAIRTRRFESWWIITRPTCHDPSFKRPSTGWPMGGRSSRSNAAVQGTPAEARGTEAEPSVNDDDNAFFFFRLMAADFLRRAAAAAAGPASDLRVPDRRRETAGPADPARWRSRFRRESRLRSASSSAFRSTSELDRLLPPRLCFPAACNVTHGSTREGNLLGGDRLDDEDEDEEEVVVVGFLSGGGGRSGSGLLFFLGFVAGVEGVGAGAGVDMGAGAEVDWERVGMMGGGGGSVVE